MLTLALHLKGTSPERLAMKELAEYLKILSDLVGAESNAYFEKVSAGSAALEIKYPEENRFQILRELRLASRGEACDEKKNKAYEKLSERVLRDGYRGTYFASNDEVFLKVVAEKKQVIEVTEEDYEIQGIVYSVTSMNNPSIVKAKIKSSCGQTYSNVEMSEEKGRELAQLFSKPVRLTGSAILSKEDNKWILKSFKVKSYKAINEIKLVDIINALRESSKWSEVEDPFEELKRLRGES